ncbi:HFL171Cp [Eremothecium sinecaudum]|uniref:Large ribosomal subunit protein uL13m n=1 Tax=Eremothecium sinecaudum TaxID=45286 RepID=A0A0X8HUG0_9SACH|nr:HFL171Cp [Eremothecium sinecaudum]AMD21685.1 HFL171Cp [Eremothecium sinecaudum]
MSQKIGHTGLAFARLWHHVDVARDQRTLGRLASSIAVTLMGKNKPIYDPAIDCGDYVVVTNAQNINVSGKKWQQKTYWSHSGKPGNLKLKNMETLASEKGHGMTLIKAVSGMLPKNRLRKVRLARLRVYDGSEHPYKDNITAFADDQPQLKSDGTGAEK